MATMAEGEGTLTLKGEELKVSYKYLRNIDLEFYPENPRIYSIVCTETVEPSQKVIQEKLTELEHVKQLVQSIKENGGLIDPLIVRQNDERFIVLEGNSRLAAYRLLSQKDPITWANVKCCILPKEVTEDQIFALLGEYHIVGKKDWAPFEQAGYLYRRYKNHGISADTMGKELGLTTRKVNQLIAVYTFMVENGEEDVQRWSYYDEYLKNQKVARERKLNPEIDDVIVEKVRSGEIARAVDMRDKVGKIFEAGGKTLKKFIETPGSIDNAFEGVEARGFTNNLYRTLNRFRQQISEPDLKKEIFSMHYNHIKKCEFELDKIHKAVGKLLEALRKD